MGDYLISVSYFSLLLQINPEYYIVRDSSGGPVDYILPDDTFDTVEL